MNSCIFFIQEERHDYLTAYELSQVTGRPLPDILKGMRNGKVPYIWTSEGRVILLSHLYPELYK